MKIEILFLLIFSALCSCKKPRDTANNTPSVNPLSYTSKLAGQHTWIGTSGNYGFANLPDTTYADTMDLAISVIDDSTIIMAIPSPYTPSLDTLHFVATDDSLKSTIFKSHYFRSSGPVSVSRTLTFAYLRDSLDLYLYSNSNGHVGWTDVSSKIN